MSYVESVRDFNFDVTASGDNELSFPIVRKIVK